MSRLHPRRMKKFRLFKNLGIWMLRILPIILILVFIWAQNNLILTQTYLYTIKELPKSYIGYKIMHVSDIANSTNDVCSIARAEKPDIILLSGGYSDKNGNTSNSVRVVSKLAKIAPVYYILNTDDKGIDPLEGTGAVSLVNSRIETSPVYESADDLLKFNQQHGYYTKDYVKELKAEYNESIKEKTSSDNIEDTNENTKLTTFEEISNSINNKDSIYICGLDTYSKDELYEARLKVFDLIGTDANKVTILLNGNIDLVNEICRYTNTDMLLFGGTYGVNRISAEYTKGIYASYGTEIFVSGGIGNMDNKRFLNLPEVQIIVLSDGTMSDKTPLEKFIYKILPYVGTIFDNDGGIKRTVHDYSKLNLEN